MARYEVRCEVEVPDTIQVTEEQVEDWARFNLYENGELCNNPLQDLNLVAVGFTVEVTCLGMEQRLNREKL
jgi:hypothetical protein